MLIRELARVVCLWIAVLLIAGCGQQAAPPPPKLTVVTPAPPPTIPASSPDRALVDYWPTKGWRSTTPEEQGMDSARLAGMLEAIDRQDLNVHGVLVVRNGYIVTEAYLHPYQADTRHVLYSCTKSFVSALVGIAIDEGHIAGVEKPVLSFFPKRAFANVDGRKQALTLEHLLTMTAGLEWTEGDPAYAGMVASRDWLSFMVDRPMAEPPGTRFNYCSGCSYVLSAIVHEATGVGTLQFARNQLFEPLGIANVEWEADRNGVANGGWGLHLTPREMAKLGYLYLNGGYWDGEQIVPAAWVEASVEQHVKTDEDFGYGYQWWSYPRLGAYLARGRAGQVIFVAPEQKMVVVFTADVASDRPLLNLIEDHIAPAVRSAGALPPNPSGTERLATLERREGPPTASAGSLSR